MNEDSDEVKPLLFAYCRYAFYHALEQFKTNYYQDLISFQWEGGDFKNMIPNQEKVTFNSYNDGILHFGDYIEGYDEFGDATKKSLSVKADSFLLSLQFVNKMP